MRPWLLISILCTSLLLSVPSATASEAWEISSFHSDITIEKNGVIQVTEIIEADFGMTQKHGIFRDIPYAYTDDRNATTYTRIEDIAVKQDSSIAQWSTERNAANIRIKIGDPDQTISGKHSYAISYTVSGVLRNFGEVDELYWNATGNGWDVPIRTASARVRLPIPILRSGCYQGVMGSTTPCGGSGEWNSGLFSASELSPGEGLTFAVGYAPGTIPIITVEKPLTLGDAFASPEAAATLVLTFFAGVILSLRRWWRHGRDRSWLRAHLPGVRSDRDTEGKSEYRLPLFRRTPVIAEYDPPDGLRPGEMGVLLDEDADTMDVTATLVDLASRDFLTITVIPKKGLLSRTDYQLDRTAKEASGLHPYEDLLLNRLFGGSKSVLLSSLRKTFSDDLAKVKSALYKHVADRKFFAQNPAKRRLWHALSSIGITILGIVILIIDADALDSAQTLSMIHALVAGVGAGIIGMGILSLLFTKAMPQKTAYGRELYDRIKGYRLFVSGTEKYRAPFFEKEGTYLTVIPYAIVFGVTKQLAKAFEEMGIKPPAPVWYRGSGPFTASVFAQDIQSFSQSFSTAAASTPKSSGSGGGGSSGGGFGGGGGGGW